MELKRRTLMQLADKIGADGHVNLFVSAAVIIRYLQFLNGPNGG
jgi:hypothetical protein